MTDIQLLHECLGLIDAAFIVTLEFHFGIGGTARPRATPEGTLILAHTLAHLEKRIREHPTFPVVERLVNQQ